MALMPHGPGPLARMAAVRWSAGGREAASGILRAAITMSMAAFRSPTDLNLQHETSWSEEQADLQDEDFQPALGQRCPVRAGAEGHHDAGAAVFGDLVGGGGTGWTRHFEIFGFPGKLKLQLHFPHSFLILGN